MQTQQQPVNGTHRGAYRRSAALDALDVYAEHIAGQGDNPLAVELREFVERIRREGAVRWGER